MISYNITEWQALLTVYRFSLTAPDLINLSASKGYSSVYVPKQNKPENVLIDNKANPGVTDLLAESEKAIRAGNSQKAYQRSVQATEVAPQSLEAWLLRATLAPTLEDRLVCVNRLNELAPGYQDRYNVAFFALKELLDQNPYLAYLEETDELYRVASTDRVLTVPKKRVPVEPYPPEKPHSGPLASAYRWLNIAILGLLAGGVGAVIFAPLAVMAAYRAHQSVQTQAEQVSSVVVLFMGFGLFVIGVLLSLLFLLHWAG